MAAGTSGYGYLGLVASYSALYAFHCAMTASLYGLTALKSKPALPWTGGRSISSDCWPEPSPTAVIQVLDDGFKGFYNVPRAWGIEPRGLGGSILSGGRRRAGPALDGRTMKC